MSKIYVVRGVDIDLNGKRLREGDKVELDDDTAAGLARFLEVQKTGNSEQETEKLAARSAGGGGKTSRSNISAG
jgi:hypothetical protein